MKKIVLLLFVIPLLSFKLDNGVEDFIGKWTGEDKGEVGSITFEKEGYASIEIEGLVLGGKEFEFKGRKGKMTYEVRTNVKPIEVDFIITLLDTGEQNKLLGIAEFKDKNNMLFALGFNGKRPANFNEDSTINLKKVK